MLRILSSGVFTVMVALTAMVVPALKVRMSRSRGVQSWPTTRAASHCAFFSCLQYAHQGSTSARQPACLRNHNCHRQARQRTVSSQWLGVSFSRRVA